MANISVEIPNTLTGRAVYDWIEHSDEYAWFIVLEFGSVEVWRTHWNDELHYKPDEDDIDGVIAKKLAEIFNK